MRPPAIIAVDIDGTFLDPSGRVLPGTRAEFARATSLGATILLASGRPPAGLRRLVERVHLDVDGVLLAGSNGSVVLDPVSGEIVARRPLSTDLVRDLVTSVRGEDVLVMLCAGDDLIVDRPSEPQVAIECEGNGLQLRAVEDLRALADDVQVDKALVYGAPEALRPVAEGIRAQFGEVLECAFSAPSYFETTLAGVDKGSALADAAAHRGVDVEDSVAFGDNGNDLPMIRRAGLGVAMGNAVREVREAADRVTASNAEEGIALVLAELYGDGVAADPVPAPETDPMYPAGFDVVLNDEADPDSTRTDAV